MSNFSKPVKMADIARVLNVSTVAVSKALSGQKGVSEELREKVRDLAEEMGYKSPAAQRRQAASHNIGVLIPERYLDNYESFYWKLYQEVTTRAMQKDCFTLLELLKDEDTTANRLPKLVTENKADALILIGKPVGHYARMLQQSGRCPVVLLDFYDADVTADAVISNSFYGAYLMTNYLLDKGHREIGFVGTLLATESITDRYLGYVKAMMEHHCAVRPEWVVRDRDIESGLNSPMLLPDPMPTAFVCNCDLMAGAFVKCLNEHGLRVPEDVSVVGFDNYLAPGLSDIPITTYAVDIREMARCAVRLTLKKLSGEQHEHGLQITQGHLVEKGSVKDIR